MDIPNLNNDRKNRRKPTIDLSVSMYGKVPPQAKELEEVVLGAIMLQDDCLPIVLSRIFQDVFYVDAHQKIFKAIVGLYDENRKVDLLTVLEKLKENEELEIIGGAYYLSMLTKNVASTAHIEDHCKIILECFLKREMIRIGGNAIGEAYEDSTDAFDLFDQTDHDILTTQERVLGGTVRDMAYYSIKVHEQYEAVKETGVIGLQTGIIPIDKIFLGLVAPDLIIVAARPAQGKTAWALSISHHTSVLQQIPVAWFSLEMDGVQLSRRLASIESGISHELIRKGKVDKEKERKFYDSLDKVAKSPIYIEDKSNINIRSLRTRANILVRRHGVKYIVVDYLQLMDGIDTRNKNRDVIIGEVTRGLKGLAKELNVPVIALSQLSREVEKRADKMPQLSDLRESGNIEQDADEVLFLMRPEYYNFTEPVSISGTEYSVEGLCIGKAAKNRHGGTQNFAMSFNAPCMHFSSHWKDCNTYQSNGFNNEDTTPF